MMFQGCFELTHQRVQVEMFEEQERNFEYLEIDIDAEGYSFFVGELNYSFTKPQ